MSQLIAPHHDIYEYKSRQDTEKRKEEMEKKSGMNVITAKHMMKDRNAV